MKIEKITTDEFEVIESGCILDDDINSPISIKLNMDDSFSFTITFKFISDPDEGQCFDLEEDSDNLELRIRCYNFDHHQSIGCKNKFQIAIYKDRIIKLNFKVIYGGENNRDNRTLVYTIFYEKEKKNKSKQ